MKPQKKHIGKVFGRLTIVDQIPGKKSICKCSCGSIKTLRTADVTSGDTNSCGCISSIDRIEYNDYAKEKLLSNVNKLPNGCWEWKKSRRGPGYGNFPYKRKVLVAHRVSWMLFKGELDPNILVCHKCDNPPCCNPDHLFLGTDKTNAEDRVFKKRCNHPVGSSQWCSKLTEQDVIQIRKMADQGVTHKKISEKFNVNRGNISSIVRRCTWKHVV